jgi:PAS domain S-box-containing protein
MNSFGVFGFLAAMLQLSVPSYALRLVRRFGVQRVGWFVVMAFTSLALVYYVGPGKSRMTGPGSCLTFEVVCMIASGLLVIGMSHLETLLSTRQQVESEAERRCSKWEQQTGAQTAELARATEDLAREIALARAREQALVASEAQYRLLFTECPQPMWVFDLRNGRFLAANQAALRNYGFTAQEFMALSAQDLVPPEGTTAFWNDVARPCSGGERRGPWYYRRSDGTLIPVEVTSVDLTFAGCPARLSLVEDLSPRQRREEQLCEVKQVETIQKVAGGVAHHVNNLLTVIDGHANLLLLKPLEPKATTQLEQISSAANRIAGLTRQLLAAAGQQVLREEPADLNQLVAGAVPLLRRLVGEQIEVKATYSKGLPAILADHQSVQRMLVNLVLNARDAMPQGGQLSVSTTAVTLDERKAQRHPDARPGEFVCLTVRDTGNGLSPEAQQHLFEPFFTTHDVGQAMGLGLAGIAGTVRQHRGWVEFTTKPGTGTEFRLMFPRAPRQTATPAAHGQPAPVGTGTIMLVQTEDRTRTLARHILSQQGYRVIEAGDAQTVLTLCEGGQLQFDWLLADVALPNGSGRDLAARLRQARPNLKVVYTGDPAPDAPANEPELGQNDKFLARPYTPEKLAQALQA